MGTSTVLVGHCQKCHEPIGELSQEELDFVVFESRQQLLCFDCDSVGADLDPVFFRELQEGDKFRIDDKCFDLEINVSGSRVLVVSHAHERARARGLSSSTYLNRNSKNNVLFPDGVVLGECKKCRGTGELDGFAYVADCSDCGGSGVILAELILPLWLVSGARENA